MFEPSQCYAIEQKHREIGTLHKRLLRVMQSAEGPDDGRNTDLVLRDLATASGELHGVLQELLSLYEQDVYNDYGEEALLTNESLALKRAYILMDRIKSTRKPDKLLETSSRRSHHSSARRSSRASTVSTASSARIKAFAEAAAARESAEYERLMAEKEPYASRKRRGSKKI